MVVVNWIIPKGTGEWVYSLLSHHRSPPHFIMRATTKKDMAKRITNRITAITPSRKSSSIGQGGRGRSVKISMSTMNKSKKRSHKRYRGQGR